MSVHVPTLKWSGLKGRLRVEQFLVMAPVALAAVACVGWLRARTERDRLRAASPQVEARARLGELVDHAPDGIFAVGLSGEILTWNAAMEHITGFTAAEVVGRTLEERLGAHLRGDVLLPAVVTSGPETSSRDIPVGRRDGRQRWIRYAASPLPGDDGAPAAHVVVARDVTDELAAEQVKTDFVATVSHELRTPLTPLKGFLMSLIRGTVDDTPAARGEYYRIMLTQIDRIERLITDLLDVSRIESGEPVVDGRTFDLGELLTAQVHEYARHEPARTIALSRPPTAVLVHADPFRVEQVIGNLVGNALKYSAPDRPVGASLIVRGDHAIVSIRDHGVGIPEEELERVFERFHRVDTGLTGRRGGTGLGLYIVKQLVEAMAGRIWVTSKPGQGSMFSFTLPLASAQAPSLLDALDGSGPVALLFEPDLGMSVSDPV